MPFDGVYYDRPVYVPPYHYHPLAPTLGAHMAGCLTGAYFYARMAPRLIGIQSQITMVRGAGSILNVRDGIRQTTATDLANFVRFRPRHMTHANFMISFRVFSVEAWKAIFNIKIDDAVGGGSTSITGDTIEVDGDGLGALAYQAQNALAAMEAVDPYGPSNAQYVAFGVPVEFGDSFLDPNVEVDVTVQGYCLDHANGAATMRPETITAWWGSVG